MPRIKELNKLAPAPDTETNAWRIYHDAAEEIWIDNFDGRWLLQTKEERIPSFVSELADDQASSLYWKPRDRNAKTEPEYVEGKKVQERFEVRENGARFLIDFSSGYSSGIFLDQRLNRKWVRETVLPGQRILNTFAYTGAFSVMAALAGAETTTLDLSKNFLDWTWDNFAANGLDRKSHHGCKGDTFDWLQTFSRQGRSFHGVVLDPPTFSRAGKKTFRTDRDYAGLVEMAVKVLEPGGWLLCCANTHRMSARDWEKQVVEGLRLARRGCASRTRIAMPPEFRGDDYLKSLRVVVE